MEQLPNVTLLPVPEQIKFSFQLTEEEREQEKRRYLELIGQARESAADPKCGLLVLDEVCAAVNTGLLPLDEVLRCLDAGGLRGRAYRPGPGPGASGSGGLCHRDGQAPPSL